jgi:hypothetical protein
MKKVSLILAALFFLSFSAFSGEPEANLEAKKNLKEQIFQKLDSQVHDVEGHAHVYFEIQEDNSVVLHEIETDSYELEAYIRNCMQNCKLDTEDFMKGRVFEVELNFVLL